MPSLEDAAKAFALHRHRVAAARKSVTQSGPLLHPSLVGRPLVNRDWPTDVAVDRYFKSSTLVYRGAVGLATAISSVGWQVEVKAGSQWETAPDHPLQAFLDQPHKAFDRQAWTELMTLYLALTGNSLSQKTLATGKPLPGAIKPRLLEAVPLIPQGIAPVPGDDWVSGYVYQGPPKKTWTADEIWHVMLPDPGNLYWGMSPLLAARRVVAMDLAAIEWNATSMANRAIADGVFSFDAALGTAQYEEAKDQVWEQHQGVENAHEPWVLGGGAKWLEMSRTPVEMDFNETRKIIREDALSALGIPPVVAGYFEQATLANAEVSRRLFWEDSAIPTYAERIKGSINRNIVPHFGAPGELRATYDISGIPALRDDLVKKVQALQTMVESGVPYNQAIQELELDLDPIEDIGDVPFGLESSKPTNPGVSVNVGAGGAVPTEQDVQVSTAAVLNGAQITAATAIVVSVAAGEIPLDAGLGQLQVLFNLTPEQAAQIMGSAGTNEPTTPNPKPMLDQGAPAAPSDVTKSIRHRGRSRKVGVQTGVFATTVADQEAPAIRRAFLAIVAQLRLGGKLDQLAALINSADAAAALQKLGAIRLPGLLTEGVGKVIQRTAERGAALGAEKLGDLGIDLLLDSNRLQTWLKPYLSERVAQLTGTTEAAVRDLFLEKATGVLGTDADALAELLRNTWGLHRQQASAVRRSFADLIAEGKTPRQAASATAPLAKQRLGERAATIAEHESLVAANRGHGMIFEQALEDGHASEITVTWYTAEDGDVDDICSSLADQEIDLGKGERFTDLHGSTYREPPAHPGCRCGTLMAVIP